MKKLINATGMQFLCLLFCLTTSKAQVKDAILTGKAAPELTYVIIAIPMQYGLNAITDTIKILPNRTFKYRVKIKTAATAYLNYGTKQHIQLWLKPGDILNIDLQDQTPEFKGAVATFAKYYISDKDFWVKIYADHQKRNPNFDKDDNRFTDKYFTIQDSISMERIRFLRQYFSKANTKENQLFVEHQSQFFIYQSMYYKLMFSGTDVEKFKFYQDKYRIKRADHYALTDKAEFKNAALLNNSAYRDFVNSLVMEMAQKRIKAGKIKGTINAYIDTAMHAIDELAGKSVTVIKLKAIFLNNLVEEVKRERKLNYADKISSTLNALNKKPDVSIQLIKEKLHQIVLDTKFNTGNPAPDFAFIDTTGKTYTPKDFKGKKVYIDMGAAWCTPCIAGIPAWNKFVEENKSNENVIFISLSLDDTEKEWKTFLQKHPINGMRLFAGGGFKGKFATSYSITGIPHFILLDEESKIIQYTAPRPDDNMIKKLLLKQ